jgi:hypothetical protein
MDLIVLHVGGNQLRLLKQRTDFLKAGRFLITHAPARLYELVYLVLRNLVQEPEPEDGRLIAALEGNQFCKAFRPQGSF